VLKAINEADQVFAQGLPSKFAPAINLSMAAYRRKMAGNTTA
jgi:hypothetical protein